MRADMARVFAKRRRWKTRWFPSPKFRLDHDPELPRSIGLRRHLLEHLGYDWAVQYGRGGRGENIAPLRRFLRRRIGQRWDRVYREACAQLDPRKGQAWLIRQRLREQVLFVSRGRWGELMSEGYLPPPSPFDTLTPWQQRYFYVDPDNLRRPFYVDPDDGLLKDHVRFWRDHQREGGDAC